MFKTKAFWLPVTSLVAVFWLAVLAQFFVEQPRERLQLIGAVILVAHLLELPLAFRALSGRGASPLRVALLTTVFGFTWWLPARRGIYAIK
jgi:hypothetical protein